MRELIEETDDFIQIFEKDCFGPNIDPEDVASYQALKDSWSINEEGKKVRRIHKAVAIHIVKL